MRDRYAHRSLHWLNEAMTACTIALLMCLPVAIIVALLTDGWMIPASFFLAAIVGLVIKRIGDPIADEAKRRIDAHDAALAEGSDVLPTQRDN